MELARCQAREAKQRERAEIAETATTNVREIERSLQLKYAALEADRGKWRQAAQHATTLAERAEGTLQSVQLEVASLRSCREENQSLKARLADALEVNTACTTYTYIRLPCLIDSSLIEFYD